MVIAESRAVAPESVGLNAQRVLRIREIVQTYIDRGVIGYLEKFLEGEIGWNSIQYGYMTACFQVAYAIGLISAGRLTDRLGTRKGFSFAIVLWSFAAMLPGAANSVMTFSIALFVLGLGESANFPACLKTVAEWFPKKERALATGVFNSGANIGNILTPVLVPFLTLTFTWRGAFVATGAMGFVWLALWLWIRTRSRWNWCGASGRIAGLRCAKAPRWD